MFWVGPRALIKALKLTNEEYSGFTSCLGFCVVDALSKYINLNYEKKLENFYITANKRDKIYTPSYNQVIQPIYSTSINRCTNFTDAKFIEPLLEKWINRFGYS